MSDEELDYDDPRLLDSLVSSSAPPPSELSYQDRRKRKLAQQQERGRNNPKTRKQLEDETREEGLRTNLIARDTEEGGESKALKMMKMMGFKPGEALGKQPEREDKPFGAKEEPVEVEEGISAPLQQDAQPSRRGIGGGGGGGGMGFARASFVPAGAGGSGSGFSPLPPPPVVPKPAPPPPPAVEKPRTEPLKFEMRTGRTGLGIPQQTRARPFPSHLLPNSSSEPLPDLSEYLSHLKSSMDTRRAFGLLRSARRTCEELDRRAGIDENVMWRDPEEEKREEEGRQRRRLFDRLDGELEEEEERKARVEGRRKKSELEYEKGESGTVVDGESDKEGVGGGAGPRGADEAEWLELDVQTRLGLTLNYLRSRYHYCLWCGCAYDDEEDLKANCPGEEEDQH